VAAAREQADERRVLILGLEVERGNVTVEMVDGDEREPPRPGDRLRRRDADEKRAASARASSTTGATSSRCRRDATSGTTPPKRAWSSAWDETTFARMRPSSVTTAAAVSSQDVSTPRRTI